ncbi:uncharacterized protein LOC135150605 [Daucus carota subsp. sativus]|uniref:uncharacterized protein LOC135150605 n=1 Tax=Daucus carota subsp. sativus TaxID=79200 RepID=UPI0030836431
MTWLKHMFSNVDKGKYAEIITLCWSLWRSGNDLIWNQKSTMPHVEGDGATVWVKPKQNLVEVSVDAAVFEDRGGVGFVFVARNSDGELIEARAVVHPHLVAPVVAEAMAFKEALSWMDARGWHESIIKSDCLPMVQAVRSKVPMRSYFGLIIEECWRLLQRLSKITLFFVKQSANMVAHQVVRESYFLSGPIIYIGVLFLF